MLLGHIFSLCLLIILSNGQEPFEIDSLDEVEELTKYDAYDGWPFGIACYDSDDYDSGDYDYDYQPNDVTEAHCLITRNGDVVFNETIAWDDKDKKGFYGTAQQSWDGDVFDLTLSWGEDQIKSEKIVNLVEHITSKEDGSLRLGSKEVIVCPAPATFDQLTQEQVETIEVKWYHGSKLISRDDPRYQYTKTEKDEGFGWMFDAIQIDEVDFKHPGIYTCTIEYNGHTIDVIRHLKCVKREFDGQVNPSIKPEEVEVVVEPGSDAILICKGTSGSDQISASQNVAWKRSDKNSSVLCRNGTVRIFENTVQLPDRRMSCSYEFKNENICYEQSLTDEEAEEAKTKDINDHYYSTFVIRNVKYSDSAVYYCVLESTRNHVYEVVTLIVREKPTAHEALKITLIVLCVFCAIGGVFLVIGYKYKTNVRYILKKVFGQYNIVPYEYVAYLVYSSRKDCQTPVADVRKCLREYNYKYYDPNDPDPNSNNAGMAKFDHAAAMLRRCLRMVVVVTPELINDNESEMYEIYKGMDDSVSQNLEVIFVCTREMKRDIDKTARCAPRNPAELALISSSVPTEPNHCCYKVRTSLSYRSCVTFRGFMKRGTVIFWNSSKYTQLNRALYVAMPKIRDNVISNRV